MLEQTRGVVISNTRYSESSLISSIYTEKFGMLKFMANGARKGKGNVRSSHLLPLNLVNLQIYYSENKNILRIKELICDPPIMDVRTNMLKQSIAVFITEVVKLAIKDSKQDKPLYEYLQNVVLLLEHETNNLKLFPHYFLLNLTRPLGCYLNTFPDGGSGASAVRCADALQFLMENSYEKLRDHKISKEEKSDLLNYLVNYVEREALDGKRLRSHHILSDVFH